MKYLLLALAPCVLGCAYGELEDDIILETVAENLQVPWAIDFAPDGRIFFTERVGNLRVIENGALLSEPVMSVDVAGGEGGLLGVALDPNFMDNHYVYLYYTHAGPLGSLFGVQNKVVRYTESDNHLFDEQVIIDEIPGSNIHDGGRIKFGPDGKLYIATGDAADKSLSQDLDSLAGKILRLNPDGSIPDDNPFEGSPVFTLGHRNPQGIDWHPIDHYMVSSEHGPSGEPVSPPFAHDEINIILPGRNYGWPTIVGGSTDERFQNPLLHSGSETWAPSGIVFYDSENIPDWENMLLVATLRGNHLRIVDIKNGTAESTTFFDGALGRLRDVAVGYDGSLYILTSNRDGRGIPAFNDDRILKVSIRSDVPDGITGESGAKFDQDRNPSPRAQLRAGAEPYAIQCNDGLNLVIREADGLPACISLSDMRLLQQFGWNLSQF